MKLSVLEAQFVRYETKIEEVSLVDGDPLTWHERGRPSRKEVRPVHYTVYVDTLAEAQGIFFLCPLCFQKNGGNVGTHGIDVSFEGRGVTPEQGSHNSSGDPSRWSVTGTGYDDLTLSPSVHLAGKGCGWHGWVQNGQAK